MAQAGEDRRTRLEAILRESPVIPVVTIADAAHAVPLARALLEGGIAVVEVTLRTPAATEAIRRIRAEVPSIVPGAGTVLSPARLEQVEKLDVAFAVSPGATARLLEAARASPVPLLPGVATASEAMTVLESGFTLAKLFPAEPAGGVALLKALAGPLPELRFCPMGGIDAGNAAAYLALSNVLCVGGSWLAPSDAIAAGDWRRITALARAASELRGGAG